VRMDCAGEYLSIVETVVKVHTCESHVHNCKYTFPFVLLMRVKKCEVGLCLQYWSSRGNEVPTCVLSGSRPLPL